MIQTKSIEIIPKKCYARGQLPTLKALITVWMKLKSQKRIFCLSSTTIIKMKNRIFANSNKKSKIIRLITVVP